jgi:hypothetical protein
MKLGVFMLIMILQYKGFYALYDVDEHIERCIKFNIGYVDIQCNVRGYLRQ